MNNYLLNLIGITRGRRVLRPLLAVFYLTGRCNLSCAYCEDYDTRRTGDDTAEPGTPSLNEPDRVLVVLRQAMTALILTVGEPLLYPHLAPLRERARAAYCFQHLTLLTRGLLLAKHPWPRYDLLVAANCRVLVERVISCKKQGQPGGDHLCPKLSSSAVIC